LVLFAGLEFQWEEGDAMKKFKVLLVDDEEEFVNTLSERLEMRDLNSETALNGEQALQIVTDEEPDVMVLDLKMPGIDGMEVLRRVRKAYPKVQVIILTGHGTDKDAEEAKKLGAYSYLQKPVDIDHLVKVMKDAFRKKVDDAMMAATFAEAGEFETAKDIMRKDDKDKKKEQ
jgi:DNA-binding NtrC family response regulator